MSDSLSLEQKTDASPAHILRNRNFRLLWNGHQFRPRHPSQPLFPEDDHGEELESPAWLADPSASVQSAVEEEELSKDIYKMPDELPSAYRSVLTLIDLYGLDYTEAARVLKAPIGTIKSRLARARQRMKEKLQARPGYFGKTEPVMVMKTSIHPILSNQ